MSATSATFTVYFNGQFWVGVLEHDDGTHVRAAQTVFGAEPTDKALLTPWAPTGSTGTPGSVQVRADCNRRSHSHLTTVSTRPLWAATCWSRPHRTLSPRRHDIANGVT